MRLELFPAAFALATLLSALALSAPVTGDSGGLAAGASPRLPGAAPLASAASPRLQRLLGLLAERAALHHSLLYRFQCTEDLTRRVNRRPEFSHSGYLPEETMHERYGIVLERGETGVARAIREELDRKGRVRLSRKGEPVEAELPPEFDPVVKAVPHAQAAIFTAAGQAELEFHLLSDAGKDDPAYRIKCPTEHMAVEFLDRHPPEPLPECSAQASGQMCVDPRNGEISALVFYGLDRTADGCTWDREAPFAVVEQGLIETKTGARFPSRVKTLFSLNRKDNTVFEQRFEDCGFTHVEVKEIYGGVREGSKP